MSNAPNLIIPGGGQPQSGFRMGQPTKPQMQQPLPPQPPTDKEVQADQLRLKQTAQMEYEVTKQLEGLAKERSQIDSDLSRSYDKADRDGAAHFAEQKAANIKRKAHLDQRLHNIGAMQVFAEKGQKDMLIKVMDSMNSEAIRIGQVSKNVGSSVTEALTAAMRQSSSLNSSNRVSNSESNDKRQAYEVMGSGEIASILGYNNTEDIQPDSKGIKIMETKSGEKNMKSYVYQVKDAKGRVIHFMSLKDAIELGAVKPVSRGVLNSEGIAAQMADKLASAFTSQDHNQQNYKPMKDQFESMFSNMSQAAETKDVQKKKALLASAGESMLSLKNEMGVTDEQLSAIFQSFDKMGQIAIEQRTTNVNDLKKTSSKHIDYDNVLEEQLADPERLRDWAHMMTVEMPAVNKKYAIEYTTEKDIQDLGKSMPRFVAMLMMTGSDNQKVQTLLSNIPNHMRVKIKEAVAEAEQLITMNMQSEDPSFSNEAFSRGLDLKSGQRDLESILLDLQLDENKQFRDSTESINRTKDRLRETAQQGQRSIDEERQRIQDASVKEALNG